jgi:hypothetical protein
LEYIECLVGGIKKTGRGLTQKIRRSFWMTVGYAGSGGWGVNCFWKKFETNLQRGYSVFKVQWKWLIFKYLYEENTWRGLKLTQDDSRGGVELNWNK